MLRALEAQGRREGHRAEVGRGRGRVTESFLVQISPEWGFVGRIGVCQLQSRERNEKPLRSHPDCAVIYIQTGSILSPVGLKVQQS